MCSFETDTFILEGKNDESLMLAQFVWNLLNEYP